MKRKIVVSFLFCHVLPLYSLVILNGNGQSPQTFNQQVLSKVFDRATGTFYVGLFAGAGNYAVSKINRSGIQSTAHAFTPIATNQAITNLSVMSLGLSTTIGNTMPTIVGAIQSKIPTRVFAMNTSGSQFVQSDQLLDASGFLGQNGQATSGIVPDAIAANSRVIFVPVAPSLGMFGTEGSGIAVVNINKAINLSTPTLTSLVQTSAVPGDPGIKAVELDITTPQVKIQDNATSINPDDVDLFWDDPLQRLYVGLSVVSGSNVGDGAKSVVVGRESNGVLQFANIAPDSTFTAGDNHFIVGVVNADLGSTQTVSASTVRVMHTSTGPSYLIVNGGNGGVDCGSTFTFTFTSTAGNQVGNEIFAIPLVDDPTNPLTNGTEADKNSALVIKDQNLGTFKFITPATSAAGLTLDTDEAARVGGCPFPLNPPLCISDMVVVGDTVYASSNVPQSALEESGIFYSQAIFDNVGKIARWTPWAKRVFPFAAIPDPMAGRIRFFDVDLLTGNIIAVGNGETTVGVTQWDFGSNPESLTKTINTNMPGGVYSVLDLDQATTCLGAATPFRYALFGGAASVAFALTSSSLAPSAPFNINPSTEVPYSQTVIDDFSLPQNFLLTTIPGCNYVTSLEFSRTCTTQGITDYFFAGTQNGLFVFTDPNGNGLDVTTFNTLDKPPLSTGIWQKAPNIPGSIVSVKSTGKALYVLTFQTSKKMPFQNNLYVIPFTSNISTMFSPSKIHLIAQTRTNPVFGCTTQFTGIQIVKTGATPGNDAAAEQLVLTTNTGLYVSNADQTVNNGIIDATNQTQANWELFANTGGTMFSNVFGMDTPVPSTVWPLSIRDQFGLKTWNRTSLNQLSAIGNAAGTAPEYNADFIPAQFNGSSTLPQFTTLPSLNYFFSDGARRIGIGASGDTSGLANKLIMLPYNIQEWNANLPAQQFLNIPAFISQAALFWIKQIGATGILMVGTSKGVISLE